MTPGTGSEAIRLDECWTLMSTEQVGRLAFRLSTGVTIVPVDFLVHDRLIYFRSAPGSKLADLRLDPHIAFETEGSAKRQIWSVVIHGLAERLHSDEEIVASGISRLRVHARGDMFNYVRITPTSVTGRRFTVPD